MIVVPLGLDPAQSDEEDSVASDCKKGSQPCAGWSSLYYCLCSRYYHPP